MNDWYPRCCPQCSLRFSDVSSLMSHHLHSGHEPPPFCVACHSLVASGGGGPDGCGCPDGAHLQNPRLHRFEPA